MAEFIPGQRWINDAQLHMGLGTVLGTDLRTVTVLFMATGETFVYAKESVPLTRVRFAPGDHIVTLEGVSMEVEGVAEREALIIYSARDANGRLHEVEESRLDNQIQLNRPTERLFNGLVDRDPWFELRYQTRLLSTAMATDPLRGLIGGRISLIPHQLYIANEVSNRHAPRVLLADEVGLGKTIEAGMVIHHQLVTERVGRVLIVVPESLVHQWLVEMLRRFNLHFRIFDAERIESLTAGGESGDGEDAGDTLAQNPFHSVQLALCSLEFLCSDPKTYRQCCAAGWDMLVMDEAHHLEWSEDDPGFEYQLMENLARGIPGILLLTATPEQLGRSSHFARLRLLDPHRFPDFGQFLADEEDYGPVANAVDAILTAAGGVGAGALEEVRRRLGAEFADDIERIGKSSTDPDTLREARDRVLGALVDRHGTGRVLFRNTRSAVHGFPGREVHHYPLPLPDAYAEAFIQIAGSELSEMQLLLCPELLYQAITESPDWTGVDPRVEALADILQKHRREKILVIAASADTALDLAEWLRVAKGIGAAVFHEGMSLLERDRAAAWFADRETNTGAHVLICSEIGSEGRNFQFAHHLVLFDLPLNPDLLEQRIGRLDRIGQTRTIHLHVMFMQDTAQEVMYHWYHEGLNAFARTCPVGHAVFARMREEITRVLHDPARRYQDLVAESAAHYRELSEALQQGRDRLLEYNSCRPGVAEHLCRLSLSHDRNSTLKDYMETVFDCFGVDHEFHSEGCYAINPGAHTTLPLPTLPDEGMTVTYERATALSFEDVNYLTWDHPLVTDAMDMILGGELGNTSVIAVPLEGVEPGVILLEAIFVLESASSETLRSNRYLPPTTIRTLIDQHGKRHDHLPSHRTLESPGRQLRPELVRKLLSTRHKLLRKMVAASERLAGQLAPELLARAVENGRAVLSREIERLEALASVNPNVRQEEIDHLHSQLADLTDRLESSSLRFDALRVIVAT
ncbi:MAG: RNA polymerase-associated protein RapA [Gammaproteobacteria bacterium]|nr:RNA polymerase-associated protein RapA [Gammaproteobacteria bacterium]